MRHHITHPYPLDPCERRVMQKVGLRWRRSRLQALLASVGGISTPVGVFLPAAVVHVEEQRDDIDDVDVEKHHHHYEVGAGAHAALLAGEAIARRPERRQGRAPGRTRVLRILTFLLLCHFPATNQETGSFSAAKCI